MSLREQAFQAVQIQKDLTLKAREAMEDGNAAMQLNIVDAPKTWDSLLNELSTYSGNSKYQQIIDTISKWMEFRPVSGVNGCFIAGTLVHTKTGLVPIEEIKVGDWVLSPPEMKGDLAYKRVANTFVFEDQ